MLAAGYARSGSVVLVAEEFDETAPAVSPDGRWLAYVSGERRVVFQTRGRYRSNFQHQMYDVSPDDQRFVMIRNLGAEEASELIVVENFFEELKAKVGN